MGTLAPNIQVWISLEWIAFVVKVWAFQAGIINNLAVKAKPTAKVVAFKTNHLMWYFNAFVTCSQIEYAITCIAHQQSGHEDMQMWLFVDGLFPKPERIFTVYVRLMFSTKQPSARCIGNLDTEAKPQVWLCESTFIVNMVQMQFNGDIADKWVICDSIELWHSEWL